MVRCFDRKDYNGHRVGKKNKRTSFFKKNAMRLGGGFPRGAFFEKWI